MFFKSLDNSVKDIDTKKGVVSGYFSAFGNLDSDGDIIEKGAYDRTIRERGPKSNQPRIKHLKNHDSRQAPGRLTELSEDGFGLFFVSQLARSGKDFTTLARDTLIEYDAGIITEHSVGFETITERTENENNVITEIRLWEGSSLSAWGANSNTPATGVKDQKDDLIKYFKYLEKALKIGEFSDQKLKELEIHFKALQKAFNEVSPQKTDDDLVLLETFTQNLKVLQNGS